jgi:hypothetical protein
MRLLSVYIGNPGNIIGNIQEQAKKWEGKFKNSRLIHKDND